MNILDDAFDGITLGTAQHFHNLSVLPLIGGTGAPAGESWYDTLDSALGAGSLRVTETSDAGSVPEIKVLNRGGRPVLIIDGDELVGAKQNRTVNLTILVPAQADLVVPVTCVEAGRWHARSAQFASAQRAHFAEGRAAKSRQVTESLRTRGVAAADQGQVWGAIAAKAERLQARSSTGAMADVFEAHAAGVDAYVRAITATDRQRGAVFVIEGRALGLDLFDSPHTFRAMLPRLVRSYAIDAIDRRMAREAPASAVMAPDSRSVGESVAEFLSLFRNAEAQRHPSVGTGECWRISSSALSGGGLMVEDRAVHLSVFRV